LAWLWGDARLLLWGAAIAKPRWLLRLRPRLGALRLWLPLGGGWTVLGLSRRGSRASNRGTRRRWGRARLRSLGALLLLAASEEVAFALLFGAQRRCAGG
jgi:hypothetical protein